ncbi:hypothetical protein XPN_1729, partial [Xanthomonas arboricola pv. pruni MAFF 301427]
MRCWRNWCCAWRHRAGAAACAAAAGFRAGRAGATRRRAGPAGTAARAAVHVIGTGCGSAGSRPARADPERAAPEPRSGRPGRRAADADAGCHRAGGIRSRHRRFLPRHGAGHLSGIRRPARPCAGRQVVLDQPDFRAADVRQPARRAAVRVLAGGTGDDGVAGPPASASRRGRVLQRDAGRGRCAGPDAHAEGL